MATTNHLIPLFDRQGRCTYVNVHLIESVRYVPKEGKVQLFQSGRAAFYECKTRAAFSDLLDTINSYLSGEQPMISKLRPIDNNGDNNC